MEDIHIEHTPTTADTVQQVAKQVTDLVTSELITSLTSKLTEKMLAHIDDSISTPAIIHKKLSAEVEVLMKKLYESNENLSASYQKLLSCPHDEARITALSTCVYEILNIIPTVYETLRLTYEA